MWGYPCGTESPKLYWGARAILEQGKHDYVGYGEKRKLHWVPGHLDLLWDRQSFVGQEDPDKQKFIDWVNGKVLPAVRKWAETIPGDSREVFSFDGEGFVLKASPNGSYGYVYIGAWRKEG